MNNIVVEKSPLLEAACYFEFNGGSARNSDFPGHLYERVKSTFPNQRKRGVEAGVPSDEHPLRLYGLGNSIGVHIGLNRLSINQLSLDATWPTFLESILMVFNEFWEEGRPEFISALSLRYVNRFVMPNGPTYYDEFLKVHPKLPEGRRELPWIDWAQSVSILRKEINGVLGISSGINAFDPPEGSDESYVYLDLQMAYLNVSNLAPEDRKIVDREHIPLWLEQAHEDIRKTFFDSLTDLSKASIGYRES